MVEGLSWFGAAFLPVVLAILSELMGSRMLKSTVLIQKVLIHNAISVGMCLIVNGFIFQHDNDPKHTANASGIIFGEKIHEKTLTVMDWPSQSPDLNIIEAVWDHLDRERNKRQPKSKEELWEVLKEAWYNIPDDYFRKLHDSLPKTVQDALSAKGGHTKY